MGFFYPPFIHISHFCHVKCLLRSVVWTLTYTQLTTPPESSILFYSKDVVKIHLYVVFGSSVCQDARMMETALYYIMRGFGVIFPPLYRSTPYHLNSIPKIPKIISHETVYGCLSCFALYYIQQLCATSFVCYTCVMSHAGPNKMKTLVSL